MTGPIDTRRAHPANAQRVRMVAACLGHLQAVCRLLAPSGGPAHREPRRLNPQLPTLGVAVPLVGIKPIYFRLFPFRRFRSDLAGRIGSINSWPSPNLCTIWFLTFSRS